jgi:hypothetical protein
MAFVGGVGGSGLHDLTRFDIALTRDHRATMTRTLVSPPQAP